MASPIDPLFANTRLHVVTGKGGVGKTTVAAALGVALAARGKKVLLVEVEGRQGISQVFDVAPLGLQEVRLVTDRAGGSLHGLAVDAKAALLEYLQLYYKLGRAGAALEKVGAIDFATTIAPGVRDVLLIGKVYEAAGRREGGRRSDGPLTYDAIILDAPPTGRAARFLGVNEEVADIARVGPIRHQADSITRMLQARSTRVHLVTLLEEMPVQETLDGIAELTAAGLQVGAVLVNMDRPAVLGREHLAAAAAGRLDRAALARAVAVADVVTARNSPSTSAVVDALLVEARDHAERVALAEQERARLATCGHPMVRLPLVAAGVDLRALRNLAESLQVGGFGAGGPA